MPRSAVRHALTLVICSAVIAAAMTAQTAPKNLLFYGNSYSSRNGSVSAWVDRIAQAAGAPRPRVEARFVGGQDLRYHETNATQRAAITTALPSGARWDVVILQGQSLEATAARGDPAQFRASAVGIANAVRAHSPAARVVLYQTWARAIGHRFYPGTFASPTRMHLEIRDNYRRAAADIDAAHGAGTAELAAAGDGVALLEWDAAAYDPDLYHPLPAMTLLAGMCLYTAIYDQTVSAITPNFAAPGPLATLLVQQGLSSDDWSRMAGFADRCAAPSVRRMPGSGEFLLLESGVLPGPLRAAAQHPLALGDTLRVRLRSLNGTYDARPALLFLDAFPTGAPPGPWALFPEIQFAPSRAVPLLVSPTLAAPLQLDLTLPVALPGFSLSFQGIAFGPSANTGNLEFTSSDGHVFVY